MKRLVACAALFCLTTVAEAQDDRTQFLTTLHVAKGQTAGDVVCLLCSATVAGRVAGDVVAVGGDVTVSGAVEGEAIASGGRIRVLPGGQVKGEAIAVGGTVENTGGKVGEPVSVRYFHLPGQRSFDISGAGLLAVCNILVVFLGGLLLGSRRAGRVVERIRRRWWFHPLLGLVLWAAYLYILEYIEPDSILGEVFWYLLAAIIAGLMLLGYLGIAWLVGHHVFRRQGLSAWLTGGVVLTALLLTPVLGAFVALLCLLMTLGTGLDWFGAWGWRRFGALRRNGQSAQLG